MRIRERERNREGMDVVRGEGMRSLGMRGEMGIRREGGTNR